MNYLYQVGKTSLAVERLIYAALRFEGNKRRRAGAHQSNRRRAAREAREAEAKLSKGMANKYEFSIRESVRIKVGAYRAFIGKVSEIDKGKGTLKVIVEVFGKSRSVTLTSWMLRNCIKH